MGYTSAQLEEFRDRTVDDLVGPDLKLLIVGINPSLWTAATGAHFARPGTGFTPRCGTPTSPTGQKRRSAGNRSASAVRHCGWCPTRADSTPRDPTVAGCGLPGASRRGRHRQAGAMTPW
ncbi:MAG: hypothetical protein ACR2KG_07115 [Nocardioidaceae bacterium]